MNTYDIKRLALVLQVQAEIEGMKAANQQEKIWERNPTYLEHHFQVKAEQLSFLAYQHDEQL